MMTQFYRDVPGLGHVAVSRHAQSQIEGASLRSKFDRALLEPVRLDVFEGQDIIWRERDGLRIVILANPQPFRGAKLVKTVFRVQEQARAMR